MIAGRINNLIQPAADPGQDKKKLKEACQQFEAVFLNYLMQSMRKTVNKSELFGSDSGEQIFSDMMDTQVCNTAAKTNSMGISDMLYRQISSQMDRQSTTGNNAAQQAPRGENR